MSQNMQNDITYELFLQSFVQLCLFHDVMRNSKQSSADLLHAWVVVLCFFDLFLLLGPIPVKHRTAAGWSQIESQNAA